MTDGCFRRSQLIPNGVDLHVCLWCFSITVNRCINTCTDFRIVVGGHITSKKISSAKGGHFENRNACLFRHFVFWNTPLSFFFPHDTWWVFQENKIKNKNWHRSLRSVRPMALGFTLHKACRKSICTTQSQFDHLNCCTVTILQVILDWQRCSTKKI